MTEPSLPGAAHAPEVPAPEAVSPAEGANSTDASALAPPPAETVIANGAEAAPPAAVVPAQRNRAEERIAELVAERNLYRDKLLAAVPTAAPKPQAEPEQPKVPPTLADCEYDTDRWASEYHKWNEAELDRRAAAIVERKLGETQQRTEAEQLRDRWTNSVNDFKKNTPDFEDVVFRPGNILPITETMTQVIANSENPAALAYALCRNEAEVQRISRLPQTLQAAALGRIEATLWQAPKPAAKPATVVTRAPAPMTPITAASPASKKLEDMSIDEYKANRPWAYSNR
jgi:hypothetical protein